MENSQDCPQRELQVPKQLDELQTALGRLESLLGAFTERLHPVLSQAPSMVPDNAKDRNVCEIAEKLAQRCQDVYRLNLLVTSLLDSLEI